VVDLAFAASSEAYCSSTGEKAEKELAGVREGVKTYLMVVGICRNCANFVAEEFMGLRAEFSGWSKWEGLSRLE